MRITAVERICIQAFVVFAVLVIALTTEGAAMERPKPRPPVDIAISPISSAQAISRAKAGDVLEFRITVTPSSDASEMRIRSKLNGGIELVNGDLAWTGPAKKGEERVLVLSVRLPNSGKGRITSRVELYSGDILLFSSVAEYALADAEKEKSRQPLGVRKDSKGRQVEEYR